MVPSGQVWCPHTYNPTTQEAETGAASQIPGQRALFDELQVGPGYTGDPVFKNIAVTTKLN